MAGWIAVASADHVAIGVAQGFMQVNHGKAAPLRRIARGDLVAYYSPVQTYRGADKLQSFTAMGRVREGEIYQGVMGGGFTPFRRDVDWFAVTPARIAGLLQELSFTTDRKNWGYNFRFGLFPVSDADMAVIARAMGVSLPQVSEVVSQGARNQEPDPVNFRQPEPDGRS